MPTGLGVGHSVDLSKTKTILGSFASPQYANLTSGNFGNFGFDATTSALPAADQIKEAVKSIFVPDPTAIFTNRVDASSMVGFENIVFEQTTGVLASLTKAKIGNVTYGPGINLLQGDSGSNTFKSRAGRTGVHLLSGLQGADTYAFSDLWGFAAIVEPPDLEIGGQPIPEALDTLDFSSKFGDIEVDVYEVGAIADTLDSIIPGLDFSGFADVTTNFLIVRDVALGSLLADYLPSGSNDGFIDWLRDNGAGMVVATDIESLVGPRLGNMTVRLHGNASLRGTVDSGSLGTVTLDYSDYDSAVTVDIASGFNMSFPSLTDALGIDLSELAGDIFPEDFLSSILNGNLLPSGVGLDNTAAWVQATGIEGHRLGGLTTLVDGVAQVFGEDGIGETLAQYAVSGLINVIGSPQADSFIGGERNIIWQMDSTDSLTGTGNDTLDLHSLGNAAPDFTVNMSTHEFSDGTHTTTASSLRGVISGYGDDTLIGADKENFFKFIATSSSDGWGVDNVEGGGQRNTLEFDVPDDWEWQLRNVTLNGIEYSQLYFIDGNGTEMPHQVNMRKGAEQGDYVFQQEGSGFWSQVSAGSWDKETVELSLDSLVTVDSPTGLVLNQIPQTVLDAAVSSFAGKTLRLDNGDGTFSNQTLTAGTATDNNGVVRPTIGTDNGNVLLDAALIPFLLVDLPDAQLSNRGTSGEILIDATAADLGWHVDPVTNAPTNTVDLTSVVIHELAQRLNIDTAATVMQSTLNAGTKRLPDSVLTIGSTAFNDAPLQVDSTSYNSLALSDAGSPEIVNLITEAVNLWQTASASYTIIGNSGGAITVPTPTVRFQHLTGNEVARALNGGIILLDPTAAGHGWFVDTSLNGANADSDIPADKMDLYTVLIHEIGHSIGFGHDLQPGANDVLDEALVPGQRRLPPTGAINLLTLDSSDQAKLSEGLDAFGSWVAEMGTNVDEVLSVEIPFVDTSLNQLFGLNNDAATKLTANLNTSIIDVVQSIFAGAGPVTNADIAASTHIDFANSTNPLAFVANVDLPELDFSTDVRLDLSSLDIAGIDPAELGLQLDGDVMLAITGDVDLEFIFGVDPSGQFYVDAPGFTADFSISNGGTPINVGLGFGPFGVEIADGHIDLGAQMRLGTSARLFYQDLISGSASPLFVTPSLGAAASYDIDLPLNLTGGLAGLQTDDMAIRAKGEIPNVLGSLSSLVESIDFEFDNLEQLLGMRGVSLEMVLGAIRDGLDYLVADDSVLYQKLPGVNKTTAEILGDGTDFLSTIRNEINTFLDSGGSNLNSLQDDINQIFNGVLGAGTDPFHIEYQDNTFLMDFGFEKVLASTQYSFQVDLKDYLSELNLPQEFQDKIAQANITIGDANGNITIDVEGVAGVDLNFGLDLSNILSPDAYFVEGSQIYVGLQAATANPIDFEVNLPLGIAGLEEVGFLIDDATAEIGVNVGYGLVDTWHLGQGSANLSAVVEGSAELNLPLFLSPGYAVGGTTDDLDGNGFADHVLHLGATLQDGSIDWEAVGPGMDQLFSVSALLNDPGKVLLGLETAFNSVEGDTADKLNSLELPFIADALQDKAGFIGDLRDQVLGVPDGEGVYTDGKLGQKLQQAAANGDSVIDLLKQEFFAALSDFGGQNLLKKPQTDANGDPVVDADGNLVYDQVQSADDIAITITEDGVALNVLILGDVFDPFQVPLNFDASLPSLGLQSNGAALDVSMTYQFGFGFGLSSKDGLYFDTSGVTESGAELSLDLNVELSSTAQLDAQIAFLHASLQEANDEDGASRLYGQFQIDVADADNNGRWALLKGEASSLTARFTAGANLDVTAAAYIDDLDLSFLGLGTLVLELPRLDTTIHYDQVFADVELGTGGTSVSFGESPELWFEDVTVNAGEFLEGFVGPILEPILTVIEPIRPFIDLLTKEIGFLKEVNAPFTSLRDIIAMVRGEAAVAPIDAIKKLVDLVDYARQLADSGAINFGDFYVNIGGSGGSQELTPAEKPKPASSANSTANQNTKDKVGKFTSKGDFELVLLENPMNAVGLLLGKTVDIFKYHLPALNFEMQFGRSLPIVPGLNARLGGEVYASTNLTFGFDTSGFNDFRDDGYSDPLLLFNGFYMDDNIVNGVDMPELSFGSEIAAGVSLGIGGLVEAGVEGGVRGNLNFDFNDFNGDGKFYADEILKRLQDDVKCLFDIDGSLRAFLDAFLWIGLDLGFSEITLYEYRHSFINELLADFTYHCGPPASPDIAYLDANGNLKLRYADDNSTSTNDGSVGFHNYSVEYESTLDLGKLYDYAGDLAADDAKDNANEILLKDKNGRDLQGLPVNGDYIIIKSRGVVEVFLGSEIQQINGQGTSSNDRIVIRHEVMPHIVSVTLSTGAGDDFVDLGGDNGDPVNGVTTSTTIDSGSGDDVVRGSAYNDQISGGTGADDLFGFEGDDTLYAVNSASTVNDPATLLVRNFDRLEGGEGNDSLQGADGNDLLYGDFMEVTANNQNVGGNDTISGSTGNDLIVGHFGHDQLHGNEGNDRIRGDAGNDTMSGDAGDDFLTGDAGNDTMTGGTGRDYLTGGTGSDSIQGEADMDTIEWFIGDGSDSLVNGGGSLGDKLLITPSGSNNDIADLRNEGNAVRVEFFGSLARTNVTQTYLFDDIEVVTFDAGLGADAIRVFDLRGTDVADMTVDFGRGEVMDYSPLVRRIGIDTVNSTPIYSATPVNPDLPDGALQRKIFAVSPELGIAQTVDQNFYQYNQGSPVHLFDDVGEPILVSKTVNGVVYQVQDIEGGLPPIIEQEAHLDAVQTRITQGNTVVEKTQYQVFDVSEPKAQNVSTVQAFYRIDTEHFTAFYESDIPYLFHEDGTPVLTSVTLNGQSYTLQDVEGGYAAFTQQIMDDGLSNFELTDASQLKPVETRQRGMSKATVQPVYEIIDDPDNPGEKISVEIEGQTDVFLTPEYNLDQQADHLSLFGSTGSDQFAVTSEYIEEDDQDRLLVNQTGGVTFTLLNTNKVNDELTIDTSGNAAANDLGDTVDGSAIEKELLWKFNILTGAGNDTAVGSRWVDVLDSGAGDDRVTGMS
ncbi:MAG: hypothetical protein KDA87_01130, partial [Planctomycetales bacterium]|nr:hypothetical protein [Planctomycetales bacterium]